MATLKKEIDCTTWKTEIPTKDIVEISPSIDERGDTALKVVYKVDSYNNRETIFCNSIKF